jgi:hypothetical protein
MLNAIAKGAVLWLCLVMVGLIVHTVTQPEWLAELRIAVRCLWTGHGGCAGVGT